MFKLIKIENSGVNVPEPVRLPKNTGTVINVGTALSLSSGKIVPCAFNAKPQYMAYQTASADAETVVCYRVYPNMLFETRFTSSTEDVVPGRLVGLDADSDECTAYVNAEGDTSATVVEVLGTGIDGDKVIVRFD